MAFSIGANYGVLKSLNNLRSTESKMNQAMVRIASGLRINSASDDAGGLALGMKLSNEATITGNIQISVDNSISFVDTQSSALQTASDVVSEMQTLKINFDNGTAAEKALYESEFDDLKSQLNMIAAEQFNGEALFGSVTKQVSTTADGSGVINFGGIDLNVSTGNFNALTQVDDLADINVGNGNATIIDDTFDEITGHIGTAAGDASSLGFASSYLETKATNLEAARSRIMDADIVEETTNLSKYTIQYEATVAALAQANSTQQTVMELLLFPNKS